MKRIASALLLLLVCAAPALAADKPEAGSQDKTWQMGEPYWNPFFGQQILVDVPSNETVNNACPGQPINCGDVLRPASITAGDNDYFYFTATAGDVITFGTDADGGTNADTFIHLYNGDCSSELASDDDAGPGVSPLLTICAPYTGTYVGRVRGFNATSAGNYKAFVSCSASGGFGDNCATAGYLQCGNINLAGNTGCSLNDYTQPVAPNSCTGFTAAGRDQVFQIVVGVGGSVNLTYTSSGDGSIYILDNCATNHCIAGSDATLTGQPEVLNYVFTSPGTYYLVLDTFGTNTSGAWTLTGMFNCSAVSAKPATWGKMKTIYR